MYIANEKYTTYPPPYMTLLKSVVAGSFAGVLNNAVPFGTVYETGIYCQFRCTLSGRPQLSIGSFSRVCPLGEGGWAGGGGGLPRGTAAAVVPATGHRCHRGESSRAV